MAGPGDNTRNRPKNGSDTDAFKRAVTVCMRAISGDNELEVGFAKDKPALAGNRARLPELPKKPSPDACGKAFCSSTFGAFPSKRYASKPRANCS